MIAIIVAGGLAGMWRGGVYAQQLSGYDRYYDHTVVIAAKVATDGIYGSRGQLSFDGAQIAVGRQPLPGSIRFSGFGPTMVYAGNMVRVTGKLRSGLGQYQGFVSYGKITVVNNRASAIAGLRRRFVSNLQTALPEPLGPFAAGLLIGQRSSLPAAIKQDLLMAGLTHIIAVSGYNLTIMLRAGQRLLGRRSKRLATAVALTGMAAFLLVTGMSASITRACIVSGLGIWAAYYGRRFRPLNLIFVAAAVTAYANPNYLWSDAGWYLSFLAFFGVLIVAPALAVGLNQRWRDSAVAMIGLESLAAELMTLPYVVHMFGQLSLVALPANVLVVSLVPFAMLSSFIAGLAPLMSGGLYGWLTWPARIILSYMLDTAHLLARLPHVFQQHLGLSLFQLIAAYGCVGLFCIGRVFKIRAKNAIITDKNKPKVKGAVA